MRTLFSISLVIIFLISCNSEKETGNHVKGLTKVKRKDLDQNLTFWIKDAHIEIKGKKVPIYSIEGKKIGGKKYRKLMKTGNFVDEIYVDSKKEIKAIVLAKASAKEKIMTLAMNKRRKEIEESRRNEWKHIGKKAKSFSGTDLNGNEYTLEQLKGKIIVMNFWFVECKPCIEEMPELNKFVKKYKDKDIIFLGFATNREPKLVTFLEKKRFYYHIFADSRDIAESYGVRSYPTNVVINRKSIVTYYKSGLTDSSIDELRAEIERMVNQYE